MPRYAELFYGSILIQLCQLMADHLPQGLHFCRNVVLAELRNAKKKVFDSGFS